MSRRTAARRRPDFSLERAALADAPGGGAVMVCGVDEVGRGPLAGPVFAGAVAAAPDAETALAALGLDDSKQLSESARARIAAALGELIDAGAILGAVAEASVAEIETLNIRAAAHLAMRRACAAVAARAAERGRQLAHIFVDGAQTPADLPAPASAIVKGDGRCLTIAAAAILAKVARDALMRRLAEEFPGYGWERNAGYPTAAHKAALQKLGPTIHHRRTFRGVGPAPAAH